MTIQKNTADKVDTEKTRVILDEKASKDYQEMEKNLKSEGSYIKFQPSRFVSFLVSYFMKNYFEHDKHDLKEAFFDSKEYVTMSLKAARTQEEIEAVLNDVARKFRRDNKGKKKMAKAALASVHDQNE